MHLINERVESSFSVSLSFYQPSGKLRVVKVKVRYSGTVGLLAEVSDFDLKSVFIRAQYIN